MASLNSIFRYTATGAQQLLPVPPYIDKSHISVYVGQDLVTTWAWVNAQTISITAAAGLEIAVRRRSSPEARLVDFQGAVPLTEADLDLDSTQAFYLGQEAQDVYSDLVRLSDAPLATAVDAAVQANASAAEAAASAAGAAAASALARAQLIKTVNPGDPISFSTLGETVQIRNQTGQGKYAIRLAFNHCAADLTTNVAGGSGDIGDTLISRYDSISSGFAWGRWDVIQSPLPTGSGFPGAPTVPQGFNLVYSEVNPENRHGDPGGWQPETRLFINGVGGQQMVAETQDFSALLGGSRIGYHLNFGYALAKSPYTANYGTMGGIHAKFYNGFLLCPNSLAPGGYGFFATGYKPFGVSAAVVAPGTGYTVGDILTLGSGTDINLNEDAQVKVLAVDGSGGVTSVELFNSGSFVLNPGSITLGVSGGSGGGATISLTLSNPTAAPRAFAGLSGEWLYGFDACPNPSGRYAKFTNAMFRAPANSRIVAARNAADTTDIEVLGVNSLDQPTVAGRAVITPLSWAPAIVPDSGSFTTLTLIAARYAVSNGICTFSVAFQLVNKGTGAGAFRIPVPVAHPTYGFCASGVNSSSGLALSCLSPAGQSYIRCTLGSTGGDPLVNGQFYQVNGSYEVG